MTRNRAALPGFPQVLFCVPCIRTALAFGAVSLLLTYLAPACVAAPGDIPGDFNFDGIVSHADYSVLGDGFGTTFALDDWESYRDNYGEAGSSSSTLPFSITPTPTPEGNVSWSFVFSGVNGALAGHLNIRIDGPHAPNILSITPGPSFMDDSSNPVGVPGQQAFPWLVTNPASNNFPIGVQHNNTTHEAYAALGTTLGSTFNNASLTFVTLVTEGQEKTTIRVLGGDGVSEYGYAGKDYFFTEDQVKTFPAVPEPGSTGLAAIACLVLPALARRLYRRR